MIFFILAIVYIASLLVCLKNLSGYVWIFSFVPIINTIMAIIMICDDDPTAGWMGGDSSDHYSNSDSDSSDGGGGDD